MLGIGGGMGLERIFSRYSKQIGEHIEKNCGGIINETLKIELVVKFKQ